MDQNAKDFVQIAAWAVAVLGGLIAAWKAVVELRRANDQRRLDLRWRQAEMAKKCLDELFDNAKVSSGLKMLDWSGRSYDGPEGKTKPITHEQRRCALRTEDTTFSPGDDSLFVRDVYDELFDGLERLEHFIQIGLIRFEDVEKPLRYYVGKLASPEEHPVMVEFIQAYEFPLVQSFLARFEVWRVVQDYAPETRMTSGVTAMGRMARLLMLMAAAALATAADVQPGDQVRFIERDQYILAHPSPGESRAHLRFVSGSAAMVLRVNLPPAESRCGASLSRTPNT